MMIAAAAQPTIAARAMRPIAVAVRAVARRGAGSSTSGADEVAAARVVETDRGDAASTRHGTDRAATPRLLWRATNDADRVVEAATSETDRGDAAYRAVE